MAYVFSRIGVPLFLMITGALVLNKAMDTEQDVKQFYKHNVLGLLITTEIWTVIMHFFSAVYKIDGHVSRGMIGGFILLIKELLFIESLPFKNTWYMPMILALYTTIPIVILAKQKVTKEIRRWFMIPCAIVFVQSMLLPALKAFYLLLTNADASVSLMSFGFYSADTVFHNIVMYYIYVIIGYYISHEYFSRIKDCTIVFLTVFVFLACCIYQFWAYSRPANYLIDYNFPVLPICAGLILELIRRKAYFLNRISKLVTFVSRSAFAIYFLHMIIMTVENDYISFGGWRMDQKMLFLEISALLISLMIIIPLSKIKVLRKYLFMMK